MEYALNKKTKQLVHASKVISGLNCGCYCPACNATLICIKGKNKKPFFRHKEKECAEMIPKTKQLLSEKILNDFFKTVKKENNIYICNGTIKINLITNEYQKYIKDKEIINLVLIYTKVEEVKKIIENFLVKNL